MKGTEGVKKGWDRQECLSRQMLPWIGPYPKNTDVRFRGSALCGAKCAALLETLSAKNGASLRRTEGNGRILAALGAGGLCLRAHLGGAAASTAATFRAL